MVSEVYVDQSGMHSPQRFASLVMHELVHYKLDANPNNHAVPDIHNISQQGLHRFPVQDERLAPAVADRMAERIGRAEPSYARADWGLAPPD